jgi:hypothetical protein
MRVLVRHQLVKMEPPTDPDQPPDRGVFLRLGHERLLDPRAMVQGFGSLSKVLIGCGLS